MSTTNCAKALLDLPLDLISQEIIPILGLKSSLILCFMVCQRFKALPDLVRSLFFGVTDIECPLLFQQYFYKVLLPKFRNVERLEYLFLTAVLHKWRINFDFEISFLSFSNLRSLRIPDFYHNQEWTSPPYLKINLKDQFFDTMFPQLEELWIDQLFNFSLDSPGYVLLLPNLVTWTSRLPKTLQILRMKLGVAVDEDDDGTEISKQALEVLPPSLTRLTTSAVIPFPNFSYLHHLEYLCMDPSNMKDEGYTATDRHSFRYELDDLTGHLPSSLTSFHIIDRPFMPGIVPLLPTSVTELTLRICDFNIRFKRPHNDLLKYKFPAMLKRLTIIGGGSSSHLFEIGNCIHLEYYQHIAVEHEPDSVVSSIPVGHSVFQNHSHANSNTDIGTSDTLPSSIKYINIHSSLPFGDFWTCFPWSLHFPFLQSLVINIPMFIENLPLLPHSLKSLHILLNPYILPPDVNNLTMIDSAKPLSRLVPINPPERLNTLETYSNQPITWSWPPQLQNLSIETVDLCAGYARHSSYLPPTDWAYILSDLQLLNSTSPFMKSIPPNLRKLNLRNLSLDGFPSFVIKLIQYQTHSNSVSFDSFSEFDRRVFIPSIMNGAATATKVDEPLIHFYASLLKRYAFPQHFHVDIDGYCEFDTSISTQELGEALVKSSLKLLKSFSVESKSGFQHIPPSMVDPYHPPCKRNRISLLVSSQFQMRELTSLKTLNLASNMRSNDYAVCINNLPESIENVRISVLEFKQDEASLSKFFPSVHSSSPSVNSSEKSVFPKFRSLFIRRHVLWGPTMRNALEFAHSFAKVVRLEMPAIPLELFTLLKHVQSLVVFHADQWQYFDGWHSLVDANFMPIEMTDSNGIRKCGSPLPPTLTKLVIKRRPFDIILIDAPPTLFDVDIQCTVRLKVLEAFRKTRSPSASSDLRLSFYKLSYHPSLISSNGEFTSTTTTCPTIEEWNSELVRKYKLDPKCLIQPSLQFEEDITSLSRSNRPSSSSPEGLNRCSSFFLACQLKGMECDAIYADSYSTRQVEFIGNPFLYLSNTVKHVYLESFFVRYLATLRDLKQLLSLSVRIFRIYNSEDVALVRNPVFISTIKFEYRPLAPPIFETFDNSNQLDTPEAIEFVSHLALSGNLALTSIISKWFPNLCALKE